MTDRLTEEQRKSIQFQARLSRGNAPFHYVTNDALDKLMDETAKLLNKQWIEEIVQIVESEKELEGDMPNEMWAELQNREDATRMMRAVVKSVKKNILGQLEALKSKMEADNE